MLMSMVLKMARRKKKSRSKILAFPQEIDFEPDPENFLTFTTPDNDAFYIKAKYKSTILKITKSLLAVYSEKSEQETQLS